MNILILFRDRHPSEQLALFARRSLAFALDRFAPRLQDISLRLSDQNGPRGGRDQAAALAIRLDDGQELHLHDLDDSAERCVHRLARRAAQAVGKLLARRRQRRR